MCYKLNWLLMVYFCLNKLFNEWHKIISVIKDFECVCSGNWDSISEKLPETAFFKGHSTIRFLMIKCLRTPYLRNAQDCEIMKTPNWNTVYQKTYILYCRQLHGVLILHRLMLYFKTVCLRFCCRQRLLLRI
jgi:hypothetical protein